MVILYVVLAALLSACPPVQPKPTPSVVTIPEPQCNPDMRPLTEDDCGLTAIDGRPCAKCSPNAMCFDASDMTWCVSKCIDCGKAEARK